MNTIEIIPLKWDTEFFGIKCGKVIMDESNCCMSCFDSSDYDFISIQNIGNCSTVNREIAIHTKAYLVDVNIQFEKEISPNKELQDSYKFSFVNSKEIEKKTLSQLTVEKDDYKFSKFVSDEEMNKRKGYQVYREWLKNACLEENKYFELFIQNDCVGGYILFNINDNTSTIELIKINEEFRGKHIGTHMIQALEEFLSTKDVKHLRVGTQLNNIPAMNLYHFLGFKEKSRTSVFHLWR